MDSSRPRDPVGVRHGDVPVWNATSQAWEPQPQSSLAAGDVATAARDVTVANLTAAYTLDVDSDTDVWLVGGLTADCTITLDNLPTDPARIKLLLTQDATGGRAVTLSDGSTSTVLRINDAASSSSEVNVSWDGTDFYVNVEGDSSLLSAVTKTANYTLALVDGGKVVEMNNASARTITVPPSSSVAFPLGTVIELDRVGAGSVTIVQGAGVALPNAVEAAGTTNRTIASQCGSVSLRKRATNEWRLTGDLA